jgi:hypothetical protein
LAVLAGKIEALAARQPELSRRRLISLGKFGFVLRKAHIKGLAYTTYTRYRCTLLL